MTVTVRFARPDDYREGAHSDASLRFTERLLRSDERSAQLDPHFRRVVATTAGHIHVGPAGIAGPVVLNFPAGVVGRTGDFAMTFRLGERDFVARPAQGINTMDDIIQTIVGGGAYVNVHTTTFGGGEIRGQLTRVVTP